MTGAVIFDVDGTLVDSNDLHACAWQQTFRHFGITLPFDRIRAQIGKGGDNLIPTLIEPDVAERLHEEMEEFRGALFRSDYLEKAQPFPGVCALMRRIRGDGLKIVLATSARRAELDFHVERMGCGDLIDAATTKDDVEHSKPCPDIFEAALAKVAPLGPDEAVIVGDTPWDLQAAARIGVRAVAVRCGGFAEEALREAGAAAILDGPEDLLARYPEWLGG